MNHLLNICNINGAEGYSITSNGKVTKLSNGKEMSQFLDKDGYPYVLLTVGGKRKKYMVHRLVALEFIENPKQKPQVNHKDGNKTNNNADNLEWVTNAENQYHSRYVLGNTTGYADRAVVCVETKQTYKSTRDAWRKTGINYCHISECASQKRKSAGGFRWRYAEGNI